MEVKILMSALMATGMASWIMGIVLNLDNWRSVVLLTLGAAFMVIRIAVYAAKSIQEWRIKQWEFEERKRKASNKETPE